MSGGRHRRIGLGRAARVAVVAIVLVAAGGGYAVWRGMDRTGSCVNEEHLTVSAAPEIAPAVLHVAQAWAATAHGPGGECATVEVNAAAPAEVALSVATAGGVVLTGLTRQVIPGAGPTAPAETTPAAGPITTAPAAAGLDPTATAPDVWIPDSSTWLVRVRTAAPSLVPAAAASIASSPVVLAVPEPSAAALGWPAQRPSWDTVLNKVVNSTIKLGVVEPNRDAVGLTSLVALNEATRALGAAADPAAVALTKAFESGRVPGEAELFAELPKTPEEVPNGIGAVPLSERQVITYNGGSPTVPLAALYVEPEAPALDYPFAVMPQVSTAKAALADQLREALSGPAYQTDLANAGLRAADGSAGFDALPGAPAIIRQVTHDGAVLARTLNTWISVIRPGRVLAVVDVSGSMSQRVPGQNATRMQVLLQVASAGMTLFDDEWQVGLWTFATDLQPGHVDYQEMIPVAPMTTNRALLQAAIETIKPIPGGDTGLYDSLLAAYKTVQSGWDPYYVNSVILITDGQNDDDFGQTLDQLVASLQALMDPRYPVQVIIIGLFTDVNRAELERITDTTGGGTFIAQNVNEIGAVFLQALAVRPPVPNA